MIEQVSFQAVTSGQLTGAELREVTELCSRAYEEEFEPLMRTYQDATHLVARYEGQLVSHLLWVTRWLRPAGHPPLRTAYIEAVATEQAYRGRGLASELMRRVAVAIQPFDLGALSPSDANFYARLGWQLWEGSLFIRKGAELLATPDEQVMILRLPNTPQLDLTAPLSAEWREGEVW